VGEALDERWSKCLREPSRNAGFLLVVLFATSRSIGPDLGFLRAAIITGDIDAVEAKSLVAGTGLDPIIGSYLCGVIDRLKTARD